MSKTRTANLLGALALVVTDRMAQTLVTAGINVTEASALVAIYHHPGETIRALQRTLNLTHSGTVRLLEGLETDGFIERRRGFGIDAREVAVHITEAGRRHVEALLGARSESLQSLLSSLESGDEERLVALLEALLTKATTEPACARRICRLCDEGVCRTVGCPVEKAAAKTDGSSR